MGGSTRVGLTKTLKDGERLRLEDIYETSQMYWGTERMSNR